MTSAAVVRVDGVREVQQMLDRYSPRETQNLLRRAVRAAAKPFQAELKAAAEREDVPRSFRNVPAAKVSTRGGASGREIEARVRPKSPLFNIFEPGATAHDITAPFMAGPEGGATWSAEGRKRRAPFAARGRVRHPGMKARPLLPQAFSRGKADALHAAARVLFEVRE